MRTKKGLLGILAVGLLLALTGCASKDGDQGKTLSGGSDAMQNVKDAQTKAITENQHIPPAARAGIAQTMEASRSRASQMPRAAVNP